MGHQRVKNICEFFAVCEAPQEKFLPIFMSRTLKNEELENYLIVGAIEKKRNR